MVTRKSFERELLGLGMPGYHLIVWKDGKAAMASLFRAEVTDIEVLNALEKLGAKPGNALGMATWEERKDPDSKAPDQVIQGPPVEILVRVARPEGAAARSTRSSKIRRPRLRHALRRPPGEHPANGSRGAWSPLLLPGEQGRQRPLHGARLRAGDDRFRVKEGGIAGRRDRVGIIFRLR